VSHSPTRHALWSLVHEERASLARDLAGLDRDQWQRPTLCTDWVVEDVVAHLTAGASTGRFRWLASILAARFIADVHNQRRLAEHRGRTPRETLERFRQVIASTTAPTGHTAAWLGEVVVHGQDISRVVGLEHAPSVKAATEVARFFAQRDFTVAGHSAIAGLRLEATDGPFRAGDGLLVSGTTLALTMAMAGRGIYCADLTGPGMPTLERRCLSG
jgi:uncharacterized protein (TIGR03083 family)